MTHGPHIHRSAIYNSSDMGATQMSINRRTDKEAVVHIYIYTHNGILLSYKKECIWASSSEVDEPRACYTERGK